jgi:hypothetical protein
MQRKGLADDAAKRWVGYLPRNFPNGETDISQTLRSAELDALTTDPDDRHVCALAIAPDADYLFTHDRGYLADRLAAHGVQVTPNQTRSSPPLSRSSRRPCSTFSAATH